MYFNLVLAALIGWCGNELWWRWPFPKPGPKGTDLEDWFKPQPDPWRDIRDGFIGAVSGLIAYAALGSHFVDAGIAGLALIAFSGGKVGGDVIGGIIDGAIVKRQSQ